MVKEQKIRKLRIGMILHSDVENDIRVRNEISYLSKMGYEIFVLIPFFNYPSQVVSKEGYTIVQLTLKKRLKNLLFGTANSLPFFNLYWSRKIASFIKEFQLDLLHAHDLYMGEPAIDAAKGKMRVVMDLHENYPAAVSAYSWTQKFPKKQLARVHKWRSKEKAILQKASGLIVLSDVYTEQLLGEYGFLKREKIAIYPNVPDIKRMMSYKIHQVPLLKTSNYILYFGMIARRRGLQTAVEGVEILNRQGTKCELLAIGNIDTYESEYFKSLFESPHVRHIPWIDISELRSYIAIADICISPLIKNEQHESGVANKIFQYMLYEKPLLVSDCKPQQAIIEKYQCGLYHESQNAENFAVQANTLLHDEKLRKEMGQNGRQAVYEEFNTDVMGENIALLYENLVKN